MAHRPILISGAKVLVYINSQLFGRAVSFGWTSNTAHKATETIDILTPVELAVQRVRVGFNMSVLRSPGDGGIQGAGMISPLAQLTRSKYFTISLVERSTGYQIFQSDYNVVDAESWNVTAKGLMLGAITGQCILWTNEAA